MSLLLFCLLVLGSCLAEASLAQRMLRRIFRLQSEFINPFVALIESPLAGPLAFTANDGSRIFIDSARLEESPNTMWNVLRHEFAHSQGQVHSNATREMHYAATLDPQGRVVNDNYKI